MRKTIPYPCENEVENYLEKWTTLENYVNQENSLNKLFRETYILNTDINEVLIKVCSLNDFYSTNIFNVFAVAKHILSIKDIDNRLKSGDITLVNEIAQVKIGDVNKNFYSFATKFCSHHNFLEFPIYDSYVEKVLMFFKKQDKFYNFKKIDLKDYKIYKKILCKFKKFYKIDKYNLKQLDMYLWLLGKDYFLRY